MPMVITFVFAGANHFQLNLPRDPVDSNLGVNALYLFISNTFQAIAACTPFAPQFTPKGDSALCNLAFRNLWFVATVGDTGLTGLQCLGHPAPRIPTVALRMRRG